MRKFFSFILGLILMFSTLGFTLPAAFADSVLDSTDLADNQLIEQVDQTQNIFAKEVDADESAPDSVEATAARQQTSPDEAANQETANQDVQPVQAEIEAAGEPQTMQTNPEGINTAEIMTSAELAQAQIKTAEEPPTNANPNTNAEDQVLSRFHNTPLPTIVFAIGSDNQNYLTLVFKDLDNNNVLRNFVSWSTQVLPDNYFYNWPDVLPLSPASGLPQGFSFANNTLTIDKSVLAWNQALDNKDATVREYAVSIKANTGYLSLDSLLNRNGIAYVGLLEINLVLKLTDLPAPDKEPDTNPPNGNGDSGEQGNGDGPVGENGPDNIGSNPNPDGNLGDKPAGELPAGEKPTDGDDNTGQAGEGKQDNTSELGSPDDSDKPIIPGNPANPANPGNSTNPTGQSGNSNSDDKTTNVVAFGLNTASQNLELTTQSMITSLQNSVPGMIDPADAASRVLTPSNTKKILDELTPLIASPTGSMADFSAVNAGAAVISVAVSAAAAYSLRRRPTLDRMARIETSQETVGGLSLYSGIVIGIGAISVVLLLLTQDVFSVGNGATANELTPIFGLLIVVQVAYLVVQLLSKRTSKDADKHPRFKTRI